MSKLNIKYKVIFSWLLLTFTTYMLFLVIVVNLDPNPISLNYNVPYKTKIKSLFPQGWAFFTKNIKEEEGIYIYEMKKLNDYHLVDFNSFTFKDYFGISRKKRVISHKFTIALNNVAKEKWFLYKGNINKIPIDSLNLIKIEIKKPNLKGKFIIKRALQLPYQWYISKHELYKTSKYLILEIK
tara:strand:- start:2433 stop:2981 length:549 start_codon:yes stop_codon:yes gene_type:complete